MAEWSVRGGNLGGRAVVGVLYFLGVVALVVVFSVLGAIHELGAVLWGLGSLVGALLVVGSVVVWRIELRKARQRRIGWPVLTAWALEHDWSVDRRELDIDTLTGHGWLPHVDRGPCLVVSGRVQGLAVEVADIPWRDSDVDDPGMGVYHVVLVHLPRRNAPGSVDGDALARLRAWNLLSWDIADDLVLASVRTLDFEVYPDRILPTVELVLRVLQQRSAVNP